jgi:phosphotransferase system HPr (HPr) family protein
LKRIDVAVKNGLGLHARAAARFVHLANRFQCRITVIKESSRVDGKSILGLLTLAAARGTMLRIVAEGGDEEEALAELGDLVRGGFGEAS